jgi:uncharacterized protein (TIGR02466 family)
VKRKLKVLYNIWPTQLYITTLTDLDNKLILESIKNIKTSIPKSWVVPCNTSLFENNEIFKEKNLEDLTFKIYNEIINYCIELNVDLKNFVPVIRDMWVNNYSVNTGQELHLHTNYHISGIYVAEVDENSEDIIFESPLIDKEMLELPVHNFNNLLRIKSERNKLILFRSWLRHGVQIHKKNTVRKTLAFNCVLKSKN